MGNQELLSRIESCGIAAVVRAPSSDVALKAIDAVVKGGINVVEITFTVPDAVGVIRKVAKEAGSEVILGAGTVTDPEKAKDAIYAGAVFVVAPNTDPETIATCKDMGALAMPGAITPTEVVAAVAAGADVVKIFPASLVGPSYLKALSGPLPHVKFMPTGGITQENMVDYLKAGATMFGVGGNLVASDLLESGNFAQITANAEEWCRALADARAAAGLSL